MRPFLIVIIPLAFYTAEAQNIGIGIATPRAKLHVLAGASGNINPYSPLVIESNSNTFINLLSPDANETALLFGKASDAAHGAINYNNVSTPNGLQFRTNGNSIKMVIRNDGNVGIGNINPNAPLAFPPSLGKKITLYPGGTGDVGFAVQGNLFQMYSDNPNADIAFGFDQAGIFTERFRMKATGAFVVNGNAGSAGQVLQSNGVSTIPSWTSPTNLLYNNTVLLINAPNVNLTAFGDVALPGLTYNFTANSNAKVIVNFSLYAYAPECFACDPTFLEIYINLDGVRQYTFKKDVVNSYERSETFSGTTLFQVPAGAHTISITASKILGPMVVVGQYGERSSVAVLQIIPQ